MDSLILGVNGYLGSSISKVLIHERINVTGTTRAELDFDSVNSYQNLSKIIINENPDFIVNALGEIDSEDKLPVNIFNSIFLPSYYLYQHFCENKPSKNVFILTLGSNSAGKPRKGYPIYAALKGAEVGLIETAREKFNQSSLHWLYEEFPRLEGGLGKNTKEASPIQPNDYPLISEVIGKVLANIREVTNS
jgi:hypothetical protein